MPAHWRLSDLSYHDIRGRRYEVAVLPMGSTEPHNLHMPYSTDTLQLAVIAERACEAAWALGARVVLLPSIPYGSNNNLFGFPLTIHLNQATLNTIVADVASSLEAHGILKLVILNGHGGNDFKPAVRDLYGRTKVFVCSVDWWKVGSDIASTLFENPGEHADEMETSFGLAYFSSLVHLENADSGTVKPSRIEGLDEWATYARPWDRLTTNSGYGDPGKATAEKGRQFVEAIVDRLSRMLRDLSDEPIGDTFPY
ncbi:MAG: creatininase family protein [Armatimonadetes bacterium]|nr:creatininase family protein [Armatimonadota bacterium]